MRAASAGDTIAKSTFARSYTATIRAYLGHRWRGTPHGGEIDDAVQDVFVECLKPGGALEGADPARGDFRALLYGVVRNVARRFEERRAQQDGRSPDTSVHLDELPARSEELSRMFDRTWAQSLLREAVLRHVRAARRGDADYRQRYRILRLRHQQGLPIRDVADRLGVDDVDRVHNAYRRARREFRTFLRDVVRRHTGASDASLDDECRRVTELLGS